MASLLLSRVVGQFAGVVGGQCHCRREVNMDDFLDICSRRDGGTNDKIRGSCGGDYLCAFATATTFGVGTAFNMRGRSHHTWLMMNQHS